MIIAQGTNLKTYQGDSFTITFNVSNLTPDNSYNVYFQLNFPCVVEKNQTIMTDSEGSLNVVFRLLSNETNISTGNYSWGLKGCTTGFCEDTWQTGYITIMKKVVEGNTNA